MNYPLISEYIESIKLAEDNFDELSYLRPVLDADGQPVMSSGNFAVVFKMRDERDGKLYAVRCFHRDQEGRAESYRLIEEELKDVESPYLVSLRYMDKELFVDSSQTDEMEFPVLLMDWVEGIILDKYLRENLDDQYALEMLAYRFSQLAQWLIPQPFAHGDLKPDNILVREDGTLVLVDYDGMYVPTMKGQRARELGSLDFRHPLRTEDDFDEHIDDFPLVSILLSLKAIALKPSLLNEYGASDRLLFSERDYRSLSESIALDALKPLAQDTEVATLLSLFILSISQRNLSGVSSHLFNLIKPSRTSNEEENLSTEVTDEDLANAWTDEYGVKYSADKKRLLKAPERMDVYDYSIRNGTKVICDSAFCAHDCWPDYGLYSIFIPNSVTKIGKYAFHARAGLHCVDIPRSVISIGDAAFAYSGLYNVAIPCNVTSIGNAAFSYCRALSSIMVETGNKVYDSRGNCNAIIETASNTLVSGCKKTIIPNTVTSIGDNAFEGCHDLGFMNIPHGVIRIGKYAFYECRNLTALIIPNSVTFIGESFLINNDALSSIIVERDNKVYDSRDNCNAIIETASNTLIAGCKKTIIPNTVTSIGRNAFYQCPGLTSVTIPCCITSIGENAFSWCKNLMSIIVERDNKVYDSRDNCNAIIETASNTLITGCKKTIIPNSVISIGRNAFFGCEGLAYVTIPHSVKYIEDDAFYNCFNLISVTILNSVTCIGQHSFDTCIRLVSIKIPVGSRENFETLPPYLKKMLKEV